MVTGENSYGGGTAYGFEDGFFSSTGPLLEPREGMSHQVAVDGVDPVGGVFEVWELFGVLRKEGIAFVPLVVGRRGADLVGASEDGLSVGGHRGRDVANWGPYGDWGHTNMHTILDLAPGRISVLYALLLTQRLFDIECNCLLRFIPMT